MARLDVNRSGEIEVFARVVELGGFSAAARAFRMTPSAVSKLVARLEARLGVRLVNRSTRKLQLTAEGAAFYERGVRILSDIDAAEQEASAGAAPRGRLRINSSVAFGYGFLMPLMPGFLEAHPGVSVDITLTDTVVDLLEERADVAIRVGPLRDSSLMTRKLGESRNVVVASPDYLARHGVPRTIDDLMQHNRLGFSFTRIYRRLAVSGCVRATSCVCRRSGMRWSAMAMRCAILRWPVLASRGCSVISHQSRHRRRKACHDPGRPQSRRHLAGHGDLCGAERLCSGARARAAGLSG